MSIEGTETKRCDQGRCEIELCTHSHCEADLQRAFIMCSKNPGHKEFIPVYKFRKEHLPKGFQNSCLMELIQVLSHLTVRVSVQYTSENRPETCPHNGIPYPFYRQRDTNMVRTGTGWVWNLEKFSQMYDMKTCPCPECRLSENPETKWAEIVIGSAAHVVFDDKEGKHTTCHLFYDKGSTPEICEGVVTLRGMYRVDTNIKEDKCKMIYITHDMELADRLESLTKRFVDLQKILNQMYNSNLDSVDIQPRREASVTKNSSRSTSVEPQRSRARQMVRVVAQPQIDSSENVDSRSLTPEDLRPQNLSQQRMFESPTSDRSRPRFVTKRGVNSKLSMHDKPQAVNTPSGLSDQSKISAVVNNHSQSISFRCDQSQSQHVRNQSNTRKVLVDISPLRHPHATKNRSPLRHPHDTKNRSPLRNITTNTSCLKSVLCDKADARSVTEVHLPKIIVTSQYTTRHMSPTRNFLSDISQNKTLFHKGAETKTAVCNNAQNKTVLNCISQSTVDLRKLWQAKSDVSDQSNCLAFAQSKTSAVISNQSRSINVRCDQSQSQYVRNQSNARKVLADTSPLRHPVLIRLKERNVTFQRDEPMFASSLLSEANNTRNNQSNENKPMNLSGIMSVSVTARHNQSDPVTAQVNQSHSIKTTPTFLDSRNIASDGKHSTPQQHFQKISSKRHEVSHEPKLILSRRTQSTDGRSDTVANPALTVIVSHPHGCNKQISIGYYTERVEVKDARNLTRYVYTTPTCPGSSGAPVYVLGRWRGWWPCDHPHSGNSDVNKELNFSGVGLH